MKIYGQTKFIHVYKNRDWSWTENNRLCDLKLDDNPYLVFLETTANIFNISRNLNITKYFDFRTTFSLLCFLFFTFVQIPFGIIIICIFFTVLNVSRQLYLVFVSKQKLSKKFTILFLTTYD